MESNIYTQAHFVPRSLGLSGFVPKEGLLANGQRPLIEGSCLRILALVSVERRKVIEIVGNIGMLRTEALPILPQRR
jgi:hypothetical protein